MKFNSHSEKDTLNFAKKIARELRGGDVLALSGDLGSGKTVFAKGLAKTFGIDCIHSPTFTLMHMHKINSKSEIRNPKFKIRNSKKFEIPSRQMSSRPCRELCSENSKQILKSKFQKLEPKTSHLIPKTLCHIDAYRLKNAESLLEIGADEYIGNPEVITIIEWAEKVKKILPKNTKWIFFKHHPKNENWRVIKYNS